MKMKRKYFTLILLLIFAVTIIGCKNSNTNQVTPKVAPQPSAVKVDTAEKKDLEEILNFSGKIKYPTYIPKLENESKVNKIQSLNREPEGKIVMSVSYVPYGFSTTTTMTVTTDSQLFNNYEKDNQDNMEKIKVNEKEASYYKKIDAIIWQEDEFTYMLQFAPGSTLDKKKDELIKVANGAKKADTNQKLNIDLNKIKIPADEKDKYSKPNIAIVLSNINDKNENSVSFSYFNDGIEIKTSNLDNNQPLDKPEDLKLSNGITAKISEKEVTEKPVGRSNSTIVWEKDMLYYVASGISGKLDKKSTIDIVNKLKTVE
jgi:hypothetical protein